ncbi:MAG: MFS transporter [Chloroflexota bacterium]
MTALTTPSPTTQETHTRFQFGQVLPIAAGHFIHDIYTSCVAPLLPVLIEKLSLSLTQAGGLTAIMQIPALLNPFLGYLADRISLRYFVILAPAVTATLISAIGFAPTYFSLAVILFAVGVSVAAFHAPAPAMIARVAGRKVGLGMSLFMAAGEMSRTAGPLLAVWAVSTWTLDGFYRIVVIGWAASLVLFWRLRGVTARPEKPGNLRALLPLLLSLFLPLALVNLFRNFMLECLTTYLPTFMSQRGASLWAAGSALSLLELAGVGGALLSGTISDWMGRKGVLLVMCLSSSALMLAFLYVGGWLVVPVLLLLGFTAISTTPVLLAIVQEHVPNNRAVGNGLYMVIAFLLRPVATLGIGVMGDRLGLHQAYLISALISLLAIPPILALPKNR